MYLSPGSSPLWLEYPSWAAVIVTLIIAGYRLRRRPFSVLGAAGAAAFLAALRLLNFPLHNEIELCGSALGIGFAVVVWGPEVASLATAAAIAQGLVSLHPDAMGLGVDVFIQAAAAVWLIWAIYAPIRRRIGNQSRYAAYPLSFALGAFGPLAVALLYLAVIAADGLLDRKIAVLTCLAGLALGAAEGTLATWGYAFGPARLPQDAPAAGTEPPRRRAGWVYLAAAAVIGMGVAPLVPSFAAWEGTLRHSLALAREARAPYLIKVIAGGVTVVVAAVMMSAAAAAVKITRGGGIKK